MHFDSCFSVAGPKLWNSLPLGARNGPSPEMIEIVISVCVTVLCGVALVIAVWYWLNNIHLNGKEHFFYNGDKLPHHSCPEHQLGLNNNWMQYVPYGTPISELSVPGTHDSMTYDKPSLWHWQALFIQCQTWPLDSQLDAGIRFIDVRFKVVNNKIKLYHSTYGLEGKNIKVNVMECLIEFLKTNPSEFVIMRLKDETSSSRNKSKDAWTMFKKAWKSILWEPDREIPKYGSELKGKVIVLSELYQTSTTDEYSIPWSSKLLCKKDDFWMQRLSYEEKLQNIVSNIESNKSGSKIMLNFLSGTSVTHRPRTIAAEMNQRFVEYMEKEESSKVTSVGVVIMDFPGMGLIDAVIKKNALSCQVAEENKRLDELDGHQQPTDQGDGAKPGVMQSFSQYERENQVQQQIKEAKLKGLLKNMRSGLKSYYERECGKVCYMPWDTRRHKDIGKVYVPLTLFESPEWNINYELEREEPFQGICDVINHYSERHWDTPICLIVAADPGCGKSMFCKKILYDWATEPNLLDRYELVMLLEPKHFVSNFMKAVKDEIPSKYLDMDTSVNLVKEAVESGKVLCIVDGYDEVNDRDQQEDLQKLLNKGLFEKCDLIVTTRHWCIDELVKYKAFQKVLSIRRFEKEDVTSYMNNFLGVEETNSLSNKISENGLQHLTQEPLTCLLLCLVYKGSTNLPRIKTQLFANLLEIFKKTYTTNPAKKLFDETQWHRLLKCLGKIAFLKLSEHMGGILQFERSDLVEKQVDMDLACQVGFLVPCPMTQKTSVKHLLPITESKDYFCFVQPSLHLQEYFAAAYIYNNISEVISQYKQLNPGKHEKYQSYENLLLFVCGQLFIDHNVSEEKLKLVNELLYYDYTMADHYLPSSRMYKFWAESDYIKNFKWILIDPETICYFYEKIGNTNDMSLDQVHEMYIDGQNMSDPVKAAVWHFFNGQKAQCRDLICFKHLCMKLSKPHSLKKLAVRNIWCTCDGKYKSLWHLLAGEKRTIENRVSLSTEWFSTKLTVLTHLSMFNCGITADDIKDISPVLEGLVALELLDLSYNNINGGITHVLKSVSNSIQKLRLSYCDITSMQAAEASPFLSQLTNLNTLTLSGNPLKSGAKEIIKRMCPSVQKLSLVNCNITSQIAKEIATDLTKLKSLQVLNLSDNSIREGCVDIMENISKSVTSVLMFNCDITAQHVNSIQTKENIASLSYIRNISGPEFVEEIVPTLLNVSHANITAAED